MAVANRGAHFALQCSHELRTRGVIFHGIGVRFRVGQYLAGTIDDGRTGTQQGRRVERDFGDGIGWSAFYAGGKQQGLLSQRGLNLAAQHVIPGPVNQHIHRQRADGDDQQAPLRTA